MSLTTLASNFPSSWPYSSSRVAFLKRRLNVFTKVENVVQQLRSCIYSKASWVFPFSMAINATDTMQSFLVSESEFRVWFGFGFGLAGRRGGKGRGRGEGGTLITSIGMSSIRRSERRQGVYVVANHCKSYTSYNT